MPLKYLSNFWRSLNIPLINWEVELTLNWFKNCVLIRKATIDANYDVDTDVHKINNPENATFQITDTKLYVTIVTLSREYDTKLLEQLKSGFKRTIKWNKYRSQMTVQPQNNNLNYLIDPTFTNVNRLFLLPFAITNAGDDRDSLSHYYVPNVEIKDFNVLIDGKSFLDLPVKNEEAYKKIIEISNNNDYTTGNFLDFGYFKKNYKLTAIDLSKQNWKIRNGLVIDSKTSGTYSEDAPRKFLTKSVESSLCDYSDAYILVTGNTVISDGNNTKVAFKNCAAFKDCRTEINATFVDEVEHINIAMALYNLSIVTIILIPLVVYGNLTEMK